jgi:hypothetical protein
MYDHLQEMHASQCIFKPSTIGTYINHSLYDMNALIKNWFQVSDIVTNW